MGVIFNRTSINGVVIYSETLDLINNFAKGFILGFFVTLVVVSIVLLIIGVIKNDI